MIICFASLKGGCGKSTLATHMTAWLAEEGLKVALVDCDPQQASSTWVSRAAPDVRVERFLDAHEVLHRVPILSSGFDAVVIDSPAGLSDVVRDSILVSGKVVVPISPSILDLNAAIQTVKLVHKAQVIRNGDPSAMLVMNRIQSRYRVSKEAIEAAQLLDVDVAQNVIGLRQCVADAATKGTVVWRMGSAAQDATDEFRALFHELTGRTYREHEGRSPQDSAQPLF